jgi:hypothetical protein
MNRAYKKRARIEIQPRFKIQYPMKNQDKISNRVLNVQGFRIIFFIVQPQFI